MPFDADQLDGAEVAQPAQQLLVAALVVAKLSTPRSAPRSSKAAATWTSRCVSTPPVMLRAKLVTVIPSLDWVWVTPHLAGRRTGQRRACVRQAPIRSLRPTGRCRVGDRARSTDRTQDSPEGRQPEIGVRPGLGTHPYADESLHRSGGSLSGHFNPRCRDGVPACGTIGAVLCSDRSPCQD